MNKQYLETCRFVLSKGKEKKDRTGIGTVSYFGIKMEFDLEKGFPLLTTRKMAFRIVVHELLWFIKGDTNIKYLVDNKINIWNDWAFERYKEKNEGGLSKEEYINEIKNDSEFAQKYGDLGPIYGRQWRDFNGMDQLRKLVEDLKSNPFSRRHILNIWNPIQLAEMVLPPCIIYCQFEVSSDYRLSCFLSQRSGDVFLGVPLDIATYSLLTVMLAQVCGYKLGKLFHVIGDTHIYLNHLEQVQEQLKREPRKLPNLKLNPKIKSLFDFCFEDISLEGYDPYPPIKAKVAV